ncbi:MAG TPA: DUF1398 family protein [Candidatus Babeliales bacterium]|jgi:uncharacterized protein YbcV (DUF1398 family)|nr:DUF1398 family protein [Candidatus Babeliales bacterium]
MLDIHTKLTEILKEAKEKLWPYPKTFEVLKDAGVISYNVSWTNAYKAVYQTTLDEYHAPMPAGFTLVPIASEFSAEKVKQALLDHQQKKTNFVQFLNDLAVAGVSHYRVDMSNRTVTYYSPSEKQSYVQHVPSIK